ncbi:MAG TPA: hypothetical protein VFT59_05540 [Candidatus Saccharimonadales bacterium]|nr:hypothetical protein [Candidatus Saccharimonadales bacterium]
MSYILVVEDDSRQMKLYCDALEAVQATYTVLKADNLATAFELFETYEHEIAAMIIDGAVPATRETVQDGEGRLTTIPFIQSVKSRAFRGLMVAASTREDYRQTMTYYGCSQGVPKREAAQQVIGWLREYR